MAYSIDEIQSEIVISYFTGYSSRSYSNDCLNNKRHENPEQVNNKQQRVLENHVIVNDIIEHQTGDNYIQTQRTGNNNFQKVVSIRYHSGDGLVRISAKSPLKLPQ